MKSLALIAALSILAAAGACRQQPERSEKAAVVAPVAPSTPETETLDPQQLADLAFRASWDAPPPVRQASQSRENGDSVTTYDDGRLVPLGGDRYAFVSNGHGGDAHVDAGALAIHYLKRTPTGFQRTGAWPDFVFDGTFGAPPQWSVRTDLTAAPAILTTGGGTWQGYTCEWSNVIELTPEKPVMRSESIPVGYDSGGAAVDEKDAETMEGVVAPGEKGRSFLVRYSGDRSATVTYGLLGDRYVATSKPDLLTC